MNAVFGDTSYYLALLNPADSGHADAVQASQTMRGRIVTTEYVLLELGSSLSRVHLRPLFVGIVPRLRASPSVEVVPATRDLFDRGYDLFARRPDKHWSLTDCLSFVVMAERGLTDALTADRHFEQAGFVALLA